MTSNVDHNNNTLTLYIDYASADAYLCYHVVTAFVAKFKIKDFETKPYKIKQAEFGICNDLDVPDTSNVGFHWKNKNPYLYSTFKLYSNLLGLPSEPVAPKFRVDTTLLLYGNIFVNTTRSSSSSTNYSSGIFKTELTYNEKAFGLIWHTSGYPTINMETVITLLTDSNVENASKFKEFVSSGKAKEQLDKIRYYAEEDQNIFTAPTFTFKPILKGVYVGRDSLRLLLLDAYNLGGISERLINENILTYSFGCKTKIEYANYLKEILSRARIKNMNNETVLVSNNHFNYNKYGRKRLDVYVDLKSPYAYLAIDETLQLQNDFNVDINWLPFALDIPSYLGSAEVDKKTNVVKKSKRSKSQWNAVKYAYSDARRYASKRSKNMVILGTYKIWNSVLVGSAILWAKKQGQNEENYANSSTSNNNEQWQHNFQETAVNRLFKILWPPFWKRDLDIEDINVLKDLMQQADINTTGFDDFAKNDGLNAMNMIRDYAWKDLGVFGVPTYIINGRTLWGREHLDYIRHILFMEGYAKMKEKNNNHDDVIRMMVYTSSNQKFLYGKSLFFDGITNGTDSSRLGRL